MKSAKLVLSLVCLLVLVAPSVPISGDDDLPPCCDTQVAKQPGAQAPVLTLDSFLKNSRPVDTGSLRSR